MYDLHYFDDYCFWSNQLYVKEDKYTQVVSKHHTMCTHPAREEKPQRESSALVPRAKSV